MASEQIRQRLQEDSGFTLKNAFEVTDFRGQGVLGQDDLYQLLKNRGINISDRDVLTIFNKFVQGTY